jgi:hypothetical protein
MPLGLKPVGDGVQIRSNREALSPDGVPHLLLRFESNGS